MTGRSHPGPFVPGQVPQRLLSGICRPGAVLVILGWLLAGTGLYLGCLVLEYYWNFAEWRPRWDWITGAILVWISASSAVLYLLSSIPAGRVSAAISLLACLSLAVVAGIALPPEPLREGLFGREVSSPLWYRGGRLLVMALPMAWWVSRRGVAFGRRQARWNTLL